VTELETGFAVGAGAGSGKTRVLVDRVLALVDRGVPLDEMVAITFTEKAASELRERVRQELARPPDPPDPEVADRRDQALAGLELAQLTTIHGFCRSILATRPVEAGISPGFRVLDALEARLLLEEVTAQARDELYGGEVEGLEEALLSGLEPAGLPDLVRGVLRYPELETRVEVPAAEEPGAVLTALQDLAKRTVEAADGIPPGDRLVGQAVEVAAALTGLEDRPRDPIAAADLLAAIKIDARAGNKGNWSGREEVLTRLKEAWKDLKGRQQAVQSARQETALAWGVAWARRIAAVYRERKARMGALDFDDLLTVTRDLLEGEPGVTRGLRKQFTHLLVDEFQDTDPLQAEIILRLAEEEESFARSAWETVPGPGRLFLVGDVHQSIYRFRRADLEVFRTVRSRLLQWGEAVRLRTSFRSRPALVGLANDLFTGFLPGDPYESLEPYREEVLPGAVVRLLDLDPLLGEGEVDTETVRQAEARAVAGWLYQQRQAGREIADPVTGQARPLTYSDVAVLVRTYTGTKTYEDEFERYRIPFRVAGGRAFFARSEVHQTLALLTALADPSDEAATVAALRSPYLGISDDELTLWAASGRTFEARPGIRKREAGAGPSGDLPAALDLLGHLQLEARRLSPSQMIRRLWEVTRSLPLHALKPDGRRRLANLLKLLDLAAAWEGAAATLTEAGEGPIPGLAGLVTWLAEQQTAAAEGESELATEPDDGGPEGRPGPGQVTLMTIHAAKGLEFPVVVLLDRAYQPRFLDQVIPDREQGRVVVSGAGLKPSDWETLKERERAAQDEESRRLLYVAFTRAREQVVLCGRRSSPLEEDANQAKGFLAPLEQALAARAAGGDERIVWETPGTPPEEPLRAHRLPRDPGEPDPEQVREASERQERGLTEWTARVAAARRPRLRSASQLTGPYPEGAFPEFEEGDPGTDEVVAGPQEPRWWAMLRGSRVHEALRRVVTRTESAAEAAWAVARAGDPEGLTPQVIRYVEVGVGLLAQAAGEGWRPVGAECPLLAATAGLPGSLTGLGEEVATLVGVADLILEAPDGRLLVVDHKTDPGLADHLVAHYRPQLEAYRAALCAAVGRPVEAELWSLEEGLRIPL